MNKKFRHEFKYFINYFEYEILRGRLSMALKHDKNANDNGDYHIRSLYFDDMKSTALHEKQAGILNRKKYRIRIYDLNDRIIKLEKKSRIGQFIRKSSAKITRYQFDMILKNDVDFLKDSKDPLLSEFYFDIVSNKYRPKVIVDYIREAYVLDVSNVRITFDKYLKTGLYETNIFNKNLVTVDVMEEPKMILEVKFDSFLPDYIRSLLQISSSQRYAISKYTTCLKYTKNNSWEDN